MRSRFPRSSDEFFFFGWRLSAFGAGSTEGVQDPTPLPCYRDAVG